MSVDDPQALALAYLRAFERLGGRFVQGNAASLEADGPGWRLRTSQGPLAARAAVIALGPWADVLTRSTRLRFAARGKRRPITCTTARPEKRNSTPRCSNGARLFLAPMRRASGSRRGAEFAAARRDPQAGAARARRAVARECSRLPSGSDAEPWMGARPCTPDMLPVIGRALARQPMVSLWPRAPRSHARRRDREDDREMVTGEKPFATRRPTRPSAFDVHVRDRRRSGVLRWLQLLLKECGFCQEAVTGSGCRRPGQIAGRSRFRCCACARLG